ncbi:glycerol channel [Friedmanniomyces endolithicus]|nr:glycerol channel [Friedmanniomyces endolithicus]KAK1812589.1 glycerol channel [Friedmanniomyces endolithicus]
MAGLGIEKMDIDDGMKIHHTELTPSTIRHGHNRSDSSAGTPTPASPPYGEHGGLMHRVSWVTSIRRARTDDRPQPVGVLICLPFETGADNRHRTADLKKASNAGLRWPRIRRMIRAPLSEFMGVMLGVYASGISGAHINPAVTFANCLFRKFPWKNFPIYAAAQVLGAFCASGVVYANYKSAIDTFEGGPGIRTVPGYSPNASAGIFCTYPAAFMTKTYVAVFHPGTLSAPPDRSLTNFSMLFNLVALLGPTARMLTIVLRSGQFFSEFIASTLLMFMIYALKDDGNIGAGPLTPLGLFFIIFGIGACFGWETGYAINLARDFGPRLMSFGGFLYDVLLFTGESPINTPYFGLYRFIPGMRHAYDGVSFKLEDLQEESPV